jgi:GTPase SAR1 family protein
MDVGPYTRAEKLDCLRKWVKILYDENLDLEILENKIDKDQQEYEQALSAKTPNLEIYHDFDSGNIDLIPFFIDKLYPFYVS